MKKIYIFFISLFFLYPIKAEAADFDINAKNAILYNVSDNEILYEKLFKIKEDFLVDKKI